MTMSEGPKDQKLSYLGAGHILSNGLKITIFCFSSVATSVRSEIPAKIGFSQFRKDNTCAQLATAIGSKFYLPVFSENVLSGPYGEFQSIPIYKFSLFI